MLCRIYFKKNSCYSGKKTISFFLFFFFLKFTNRFFLPIKILVTKSSKSFQICQEFAQWYIARNTNHLNLFLGHLMKKNHYFVFQICKWKKSWHQSKELCHDWRIRLGFFFWMLCFKINPYRHIFFSRVG